MRTRPGACVCAATCGGRCFLNPQRGLRWCLVRRPSGSFGDMLVKDSAPLWQIRRLCLSLTCLLDPFYDICIKLACVFGPAHLRCEDLVKRKSRCLSRRSHSGGLSEDGKEDADMPTAGLSNSNLYSTKRRHNDFSITTAAVVCLFVQAVEMTEICCFGHLNVAWLLNTANRWWPCMQYLEQNLGGGAAAKPPTGRELPLG